MTIEEFTKKYKDQGGFNTLLKMRTELETLLSISNHFGVSRERTRQWMKEFFGNYDPRYERRKRRIASVKSLLQEHGKEELLKIYPSVNKEYLKEAKK